ncbi:TPA: TetR/AcrR family transcriptional regulator [Klebsiella pneumoniae]
MSNKEQTSRMEADDRREQIVQIARVHFLRKGYDKASISGIAVAVGVTRALVYHYFPDKTTLFKAVLRSEADALLAATMPDSRLSPLDNICGAIRAYLEHFSVGTTNLLAQAEAQPALVGEISRDNHSILAQRVITVLSLEDSPMIHAAINAWLQFVAALAHEIALRSGIDHEAAIALCVATLKTIAPAAKIALTLRTQVSMKGPL